MTQNPIQELHQFMRIYLPAAELNLDSPAVETGIWFLDITFRDKHIVVQWKQSQGFGYSDVTNKADAGYGEGADEVCSEKEIFDKVTGLFFDLSPVSEFPTVIFGPKSLRQADTCINRHTQYQCPNLSTIEAIYNSASIRCCENPACKRRAAEIAVIANH